MLCDKRLELAQCLSAFHAHIWTRVQIPRKRQGRYIYPTCNPNMWGSGMGTPWDKLDSQTILDEL